VVGRHTGQPLRVAILGGGMAGLAAAWRLTQPGGQPCEVTVYQRGWRLGGKGASSRGVNGRIEEHGLHVWLGFYDNAFRLMRDCYASLERPDHCPIRSWRDAFFPAGSIGLGDEAGGAWEDWVARFPEDDDEPGSGRWPTTDDLLHRTVQLLALYTASLAPRAEVRRAVLSTSPVPPAPDRSPLRSLQGVLSGPTAHRRIAQNVEVLLTMVRGMLADGLFERGLRRVDDVDFCVWLARHGASRRALASPLVLGMYDFIFGFEEGDRDRPSFAAGMAIELAVQLFGRYRGSIFWKMRAGMGDVVFAPLYEALRMRGVRFEFFHRVDGLHPDPSGRSVGAVSLGRQVALRDGRTGYEPLVEVHGLPVFPDRPDATQLVDESAADADLESHGCSWPDVERRRLESGRDFDRVVLAVSLGMVPHVCGELIALRPEWRAMVERVATVATQALQVWLRPDERELGWSDAATVLTRLGEPFDTFASSSHALPFEAWPDGHRPGASAMFCAALSDARASAQTVRTNAFRFLQGNARRLWPHAFGPDGFRWDVLWDASPAVGPDRLDAQYWRANTDPSDRYVQSLPGTDQYRLRADGSGFDNLALAGDWIDSGLNAGCIEAAVLAGLQAGNVTVGRPLTEGTTGFRPHAGGFL
jgi:uncharacterized protein with NAD-binding domain and iron-sulfur cluster